MNLFITKVENGAGWWIGGRGQGRVFFARYNIGSELFWRWSRGRLSLIFIQKMLVLPFINKGKTHSTKRWIVFAKEKRYSFVEITSCNIWKNLLMYCEKHHWRWLMFVRVANNLPLNELLLFVRIIRVWRFLVVWKGRDGN